jgi:hypothetical protein
MKIIRTAAALAAALVISSTDVAARGDGQAKDFQVQAAELLKPLESAVKASSEGDFTTKIANALLALQGKDTRVTSAVMLETAGRVVVHKWPDHIPQGSEHLQTAEIVARGNRDSLIGTVTSQSIPDIVRIATLQAQYYTNRSGITSEAMAKNPATDAGRFYLQPTTGKDHYKQVVITPYALTICTFEGGFRGQDVMLGCQAFDGNGKRRPPELDFEAKADVLTAAKRAPQR